MVPVQEPVLKRAFDCCTALLQTRKRNLRIALKSNAVQEASRKRSDGFSTGCRFVFVPRLPTDLLAIRNPGDMIER